MASESEHHVSEPLTPREREVLDLLRLGLTDREIADRLGVSTPAVSRHVSTLIGKLGVRNRYEAAAWPDPPPWWAGALAPVALAWRRGSAALPVKASSLAAGVSGGIVLALVAGLTLVAVLLARGGGTENDLGVDGALAFQGAPSGEGDAAPTESSSAEPATPRPGETALLPAQPGPLVLTQPPPRDDASTPEPPDDESTRNMDPAADPPRGPSTPAPAPAPAGTGGIAIDCDVTNAGVQRSCAYPSDAAFAVQVHVIYPPLGGYLGLQAKLAWNDAQLDYIPKGHEGFQARWPECAVPASLVSDVIGAPSLLAACVLFPWSAEGSIATGPALEFRFECQEDGRAPIRMLARRGDEQNGSHFLDAHAGPIDPTLISADVQCGPCPSGDCPSPALNGIGRVAVDCNALAPGVQSNCAHAVGERYTAQIHILEPPAGGFSSLNGSLRWNETLASYPPPPAGRALDDCGFAHGSVGAVHLRDDASYGSVIWFGCGGEASNLPADWSTFTGPFLELPFECHDRGVVPLVLDAFLDASIGYTYFAAGEDTFAPVLENAVVNCE